jgi:hypothetical protein
MMNERIIELADKAVEGISSGPWNISDEFCIKFAELIVRECIDKIENEAAQYAEPVWAFELVNDIKEHFGVEE